MLAGDVGVLHLLGDLEGVVEHGVQARPDAHLRRGAGHLGGGGERLAHRGIETRRVSADLREDRAHDALGLVEQRLEQVLRFDRAGAELLGDAAGRLERFLRLDGELVESHRAIALRNADPRSALFYPPDTGDSFRRSSGRAFAARYQV